MSNKDKFFDDIATMAKDKYKKYLAESEDKTNSPMREDTYANGVRDGLSMYALLVEQKLGGNKCH